MEELVNEFEAEDRAAGYLSCMIALLYFGSVYALEKIGSSTIWTPLVREILANYAYVVSQTAALLPTGVKTTLANLIPYLCSCPQFCTIFWVGFSHIGGNISSTHLGRVPTTDAFHPTQPRGWLIDFWNLEVKWVFVAAPFGFLVMLLFYYDHVRRRSSQITLCQGICPR
jgi:hypothetical protein